MYYTTWLDMFNMSKPRLFFLHAFTGTSKKKIEYHEIGQ